jgi:hypothetical protein
MGNEQIATIVKPSRAPVSDPVNSEQILGDNTATPPMTFPFWHRIMGL